MRRGGGCRTDGVQGCKGVSACVQVQEQETCRQRGHGAWSKGRVRKEEAGGSGTQKLVYQK